MNINVKTFNTCFDNINLNLANLKNKNFKNGPDFSFFYEYAHDKTILSLSIDESGTYMATGSADHSIRIHNLKKLLTEKELYHKKCGHFDWVNKVFFTKRNEILSGGLDGKLCLWNTTYACKAPKVNKIMNCSEYIKQEKKVKEIKFKASSNTITCKEICAHHSTISDMKFNKQNEKCITSSYDKTLKIFDIKKFRELAIYKGSHSYPITSFLWLQNKIISADKNGTICVFDVETSQEILNAPNTHTGNVGALNYFYLYKNGCEDINARVMSDQSEMFDKSEAFDGDKNESHPLKIEDKYNKKKFNKSEQKRERLWKEKNVNIINSDNLFYNNNLNNDKIPLIITGGQRDGVIKIRDFRIFHKYVSCKKMHTGSINCIITYNLKNQTYIISCSADGYCYQFEIQGICSSLNNYLKKVYINEPILSAKYIGNHLILVGTAFGNLFLLNFSDCSKNELTKQEKQILNASNELNTDNNFHVIEKNNNQYNKTNDDILWGFGGCKKGGINCIECIYIYNSKNINPNEVEICNIIIGGDDGIPCLLSIPNSFI
ncbi:WD repeat-containing protein, putative [Plasmodium berghei]|uniref:WD repeat-containing protein, putative n=2 Tax=Plasmodium berghei TaxID=5821 RepID=A0A509AJZ4_PLABA|nr:WD repeat-containing protein, putative [Plasmodium berghei ANKA]CXI43753.1 WD repeat-containing protein, putative [Plasmodium berghei]SCM22388.1 WD repeat-containing protein, putative [Plasmodium berghei]SCN25414.1 WD repeat-containing protein, putative [Plasmodium berghei]SCO60391.1 WD repeat-containing protein, putative [Plasmodium berghei]SCO62155.1 WD repeat-containing protein, putative [Plasmodium berghei]|eukprot:XP_034421619.1 WD repeat-containing protein, putative [Plasmodium berghei ANKA]